MNKTTEKGQFISHVDCPACGSSDANAIYLDKKTGEQYTFCFSCKTRKSLSEDDYLAPPKESKELTKPSIGKTSEIKERNISRDTCKKFGVTVDGATHYYPVYNENLEHVGNKVRRENKKFYFEGSPDNTLMFGQHTFPPGGKYITVTEGELDALAVYELFSGKAPAVSIKFGAASATKDLSNPFVYDYLNSFDNIVVCMDNDKPGQAAAKKFASMFSPGKCLMFGHKQGFKDPCDYLAKGEYTEFTKAWWQSEPYTPENIIPAAALKNAVLTDEKPECYSTPWEGLNERTYGLRLHEMWTWKADTGVGKTQVFKELEHHVRKTTDFNIGIMHIEETPTETMKGLMSLELDKPIHLPDTVVSLKELEESFDKVVVGDKLYLYDSFGSDEVDSILNKIRYYVMVLDCRFLFLDHIHMITADQRHDSERDALNELASKFKNMTIETPLMLNIVAHVNREGEIYGTSFIEKLSNMVISLERDKKNTDPIIRNKTLVRVEKNRFCGRTGPACYLDYIPETGRLIEGLPPEEEDLL